MSSLNIASGHDATGGILHPPPVSIGRNRCGYCVIASFNGYFYVHLLNWCYSFLKLATKSEDHLIWCHDVWTPWPMKVQNSSQSKAETLKTSQQPTGLQSNSVRLSSLLCGRTFWEQSQPSVTLWKNILLVKERSSEGETYHLTLFYIRLQSHVAL